MKNLHKILSFILLGAVCLTLNTTAFAKVKHPSYNTQEYYMINNAKKKISKELKTHSLNNKRNDLMSRAPATPLTKVFINSIVSEQSAKEHESDSNKGIEYFNPNTLGKETIYDHGGKTFICTYEIGYADSSSRKAMYNNI